MDTSIEFEWAEEKNEENIRKHHLELIDGVDVFYHPRLVRFDTDHRDGEERWQTIGWSDEIMFVVYTERGRKIRLISVRKAEPKERRLYYGTYDISAFGWERDAP
jgi:uncharacterized DUF497 family protein